MTKSERPSAAPLLWLGAGGAMIGAGAVWVLARHLSRGSAGVRWTVAVAEVLVWLAVRSWGRRRLRGAGSANKARAVAQFVAAGLAIVFTISQSSLLAVLLVGALLWLAALIVLWSDLHDGPGLGDLIGSTTIVVVAGAGAGAVLAVMRPLPGDWLWAQALGLVVGLGAAITLAAWDWSRTFLWAVLVVLVGSLVCYIGRVGYEAERIAAVQTPIATAIAEASALTSVAETTQAKANEDSVAASAAASDELAEALLTTIGGIVPDFKMSGQAILDALDDDLMGVAEGELARLKTFDVPPTNAPQALTIRELADAAVTARKASGAASIASRAELDEAIAAACRSARGLEVEIDGCPPPAKGETTSDGPEIAVALRALDIELAEYRRAVDPSEENVAAANASVLADPPSLERTVVGAVAAGPPALAASIDGDDPLRLIPGPVGWLLIALAALLALRAWLKLNADQMAGPVDVVYEGDDNAVLRIAVLENVETPRAAPGAGLSETITNLSSIAGPASSFVGSAFAAINTVLARKHGYKIEADVVKPQKATDETPADAAKAAKASGNGDDNASRDTRVLVRVTSVNSSESLGARSFSHEDGRVAMKSAGLWAAGLLIGRSTRIPSWASWNESTAEALARVQTDAPSMEDLQRAVARAPTSAVVLSAYGYELELAGRQLDAVGVYARCIRVHPRYLMARYRLAIGLDVVAVNAPTLWDVAPQSVRMSTTLMVDDAVSTLGVSTRLEGNSDPVAALRVLSAELLGTMLSDLRWWRRMSARMRRSDRAQSWLAWRRGRRQAERSTKWLVQSALLAYPQEATGWSEEKRSRERRRVEAQAGREGASVSVAYNLACAAVLEGRDDDALLWLERCLSCHDIGDIDPKWLAGDPDLKAISAHPRFVAVARILQEWRPA